MKIVTAPESTMYLSSNDNIVCFLSGGITGCTNWQNEVIESLYDFQLDGFSLHDLVLYNPRQEQFDVNDKSASEKQIKWEFDRLISCDILSVYFANGSLQPITLYELGKYGEMMRRCHSLKEINSCVIISVEKGYERAIDVKYQLAYGFNNKLKVDFDATPRKHAIRILEAYNQQKYLKLKKGE